MSGSGLVARLHDLGVSDTQGVEQVASNPTDALHLLGREADGKLSPVLRHWKEYFSEDAQRLYYCNDEIGYNSWEAPPCFKFAEWSLDAQMYGISLLLARDMYETLDAFLTRHPPEKTYKALSTLAKLVCNVADSGNAVDKYRSVRVSNPKFHEAVWEVAGATQILFLAGFKHQGEVLSIAADAPLGPLQAAASRLRRLADRKGHRGDAILVKRAGEEDSSGRPPSAFYSKAGFRYQEQIWHCSVCDQPINDGSERLWTGKHDAPHGEYRYQCTTCQDAGATFNLCQSCWDRFQQQEQQQASSGSSGGVNGSASSSGGSGGGGGSAAAGPMLHDCRHAFQHMGPRMSRHNDYYGKRDSGSGEGSNAWGRAPGGGASVARALQRLGERYGIHQWG